MLRRLFGGSKGAKVPLVDALPVWSSIAFSVFFGIVATIFLIINTPWPLNRIVYESNVDTYNGSYVGPFFYDNEFFEVEHGAFVRNNEFLQFNLVFRKLEKALEIGIVDEDVHLTYMISVREDFTSDYYQLTSVADGRFTMDCPPGQLECEPLRLDYLETVKFYDYLLRVAFKQPLKIKELLDDYVKFEYVYTGSVWVILETIAAWVFFVGWIIFTVFYVVYLMMHTSVKNLSLEQILLLVLNVFWIFYHDPIDYIDDVYDSSGFTYVWKFLDGFFICNFLGLFHFTLCVLAGTIVRKASQVSKFWFVFWGLLSVVYYIFAMMVILDFKYTRDVQTAFAVFGFTMIIIQCVAWPLTLFRFIILLRNKILRWQRLKRTILVFTIACVLAYSSLLTFAVKGFLDQLTKWYFVFLFSLVMVVLTVNYLPSSKPLEELEDDYADDGETTSIVGAEVRPQGMEDDLKEDGRIGTLGDDFDTPIQDDDL